MITPLVVGNWKMNGGEAQCVQLARQIVRRLKRQPARAEVALAPPFTALSLVARELRNKLLSEQTPAQAYEGLAWLYDGG